MKSTSFPSNPHQMNTNFDGKPMTHKGKSQNIRNTFILVCNVNKLSSITKQQALIEQTNKMTMSSEKKKTSYQFSGVSDFSKEFQFSHKSKCEISNPFKLLRHKRHCATIYEN